MRGTKKNTLVKANRMLTGILAASLFMSNLSGTGIVVHADELEVTAESIIEETVEATTEVENETGSIETMTSEEISSEEHILQEELATEASTEATETLEDFTEAITLESEVNIQGVGEENTAEDILPEYATGEEALLASVYLQFEANGGNCDISLIELTPENMGIMLPQAERTGYRFTGWYIDSECTQAFDESNLYWEAGSTYVLYAGYEEIESEEIILTERTLQQKVNGVTITVEGNMPTEATLVVRTEELTQQEEENIVRESEILSSAEELDTAENTAYSYDISICYQDVEYEPYLFDEKVQVTFTFDDMEELKDAQQLEVFHIDDYEKVEKLEIKEVTESEVCFDADAFSTYILITKVEYTGNKSWSYGFTGDVQTFTAPVSGQYVFECYGAGTGNSKGSFAKGTVGLEKNETVYIYVGGQNNTFNGGGKGGAVWHHASNTEGSFSENVCSDNGSGATDVRVGTGLEARIIVAGGGGGNGHTGGVNFSYSGTATSGGWFYENVNATNAFSSNNVLGQGSSYETWVTEGTWGNEWDSYPAKGTYSYRTVTGGGGGGYYGGRSGYAGTSKVISSIAYQGKEYQTIDSVVETMVYTGNGKCKVSLYSLEADVITYYNHNMTKLGETAGLTGTYVNFPTMSEMPNRVSDSMYNYTYLGWDDMATEEIEHYTDAQTVAAALNGDRNYIAAYESVGKSYAVTLDSADAQNAGTTSIVATYHSTLPDIIIPVKEGCVFAGYYTEQNGAGTQIYSAAGKGVALSSFDEASVIYAHWVQPITNVKQPENKEVIAGYAGVVLTTEAELNEATGYTLSYQWYINHENSIVTGSLIEAADSRKLVIPQGFQPGQYYFYCMITATNVLNGQAVSVFTTPAMLNVEKGVMGMEYVEVENESCIYDGTPKTLEAAINSSNAYTIYYSAEELNAENYMVKGTTIPNSYTDAGIYTNYIYVTGVDFADFAGSITMTIDKAEPYVYLASKNTAYNGQNQMVDVAHVYGVDEKEMAMLTAYVYFVDEACTQKTDSSCGALEEGGAPSAVGTYYVHAVTQETNNYHDVATKTPAMFNILGTNVKYSISGFHGMYDGKPHGLQIINEDEANATIYFSDMGKLTKDNYQLAGRTIPYEYTAVGKYPIYYLVVMKLAGGINQYETGMAEIVIEAVKQEIVNPENPENNGGSEDKDNIENGNGSDNKDNNSSGSSNSGNNSNQGGNQTKPEDAKPHTHNYELVSYQPATSLEEGKAIYRCTECNHELVITYPMLKGETLEDQELEKEEIKLENNKNQGIAQNKNQANDEEKEDALVDKTEAVSQEKEHRVLTEAELYEIAESLIGLTESQIRELYENGLLNLTAQELERLLAIIRSQILISDEEVGLAEEIEEESTEGDTTEEEGQQSGKNNMWNWLWAFLLGAIVMFLLRQLMDMKKIEKKKEKTSAPTRKLK